LVKTIFNRSWLRRFRCVWDVRDDGRCQLHFWQMLINYLDHANWSNFISVLSGRRFWFVFAGANGCQKCNYINHHCRCAGNRIHTAVFRNFVVVIFFSRNLRAPPRNIIVSVNNNNNNIYKIIKIFGFHIMFSYSCAPACEAVQDIRL